MLRFHRFTLAPPSLWRCAPAHRSPLRRRTCARPTRPRRASPQTPDVQDYLGAGCGRPGRPHLRPGRACQPLRSGRHRRCPARRGCGSSRFSRPASGGPTPGSAPRGCCCCAARGGHHHGRGRITVAGDASPPQRAEGTPTPRSDGRRSRGPPPAAARDPRQDRRAERSMSAVVVAQLETEMRIARRPCQVVAPIQHVPSACTRGDHGVGDVVVVAEAHQHLVEDDVVEHLDAVRRREQLGEAPRAARSSARPAPRRRRARASAAPRRRRTPRARREDSGFQSIASRSPPRAGRYAALTPSRRGGAGGAATKARPQSYGTLSHLCASVAHESARSTPATRWRERGRGRGPQAERAVDVDPRAGAGATSHDLVERVERRRCSRCRPARTRSSGRRRAASAARSASGSHAAPASVATRHERRCRGRAAARARSRVMCRSPGQHADAAARRPARAPRRPSPLARAPAWRAAARPVTCAIWQPVMKRERRVARQAEQLGQPAAATSSATAAAGAAT